MHDRRGVQWHASSREVSEHQWTSFFANSVGWGCKQAAAHNWTLHFAVSWRKASNKAWEPAKTAESVP